MDLDGKFSAIVEFDNSLKPFHGVFDKKNHKIFGPNTKKIVFSAKHVEFDAIYWTKA